MKKNQINLWKSSRNNFPQTLETLYFHLCSVLVAFSWNQKMFWSRLILGHSLNLGPPITFYVHPLNFLRFQIKIFWVREWILPLLVMISEGYPLKGSLLKTFRMCHDPTNSHEICVMDQQQRDFENWKLINQHIYTEVLGPPLREATTMQYRSSIIEQRFFNFQAKIINIWTKES